MSDAIWNRDIAVRRLPGGRFAQGVMMEEIVRAALAHAAEAAPYESCGLVVRRNGTAEYVPCVNVSPDPINRFMIDPEDYARAEDLGVIEMIVHSHPFIPPTPSEADRAGCEASGLPWLIVNHPVGSCTVTHPSGWRAPLIEREFCEGLLDCYALVRDFYMERLGIKLKDYVRPKNWEVEGNSIIVDNFRDCGFVEVPLSEMRPNDVLVMQLGASIPNHCAILESDNRILHHVRNRLSGVDVYGEYWRKSTRLCLRYVGPQGGEK